MTTRKKTKRSRNGGIRKICECPRRSWATCSHAWHFAYKPKTGPRVRLSLDRWLGRPVESKTEAEDIAGDLRKQIRAGTFRADGSTTDEVLTLQGLVDVYLPAVLPFRKNERTRKDTRDGLAVICGTPIPMATGEVVAFGAWPVVQITSAAVESYRTARMARGAGIGGSNRSLGRLRALLAWAVSRDLMSATPFRKHGQAVVKLPKETRRDRRLHDGEGDALLAACSPRLRAIVECALETGMRRGEILGLKWRQVHGLRLAEDGAAVWDARSEIALAAGDTKTAKARRIPISLRLRAILTMRRYDPNGTPLAGDKFVFGSPLGEAIDGCKRAWHYAVLRANRHDVTITKTGNLDAEARKHLAAVDLHFHDLRREAASRWLDAGTPLTTIQRWLGHSKVSQTATYLEAAVGASHDDMARVDAHRAACQILVTNAGTGRHAGPSTGSHPHDNARKNLENPVTGIM